RAHERASLDRDEHAIRDAHIGFDPPNMMRVGPWGKTPGCQLKGARASRRGPPSRRRQCRSETPQDQRAIEPEHRDADKSETALPSDRPSLLLVTIGD